MKKNSRKRAPAFQFYAADWLTDTSLRLASPETRGVWIDLLCHAFLSPEPGFLIVAGQVLDKNGIRKLAGLTPKKFEKVFNELTNLGILKQDESGRYYSKRMVDDARLSKIRRDAGKKGGNPNLKKDGEDLVDNLDNQKDNQKTTPSSSSSSSTSENKKKKDKKKEVKKIEKVDHAFALYVSESCERVGTLKKQLTLEECEKLAANWDPRAVFEIFDQMENFKKLTTNYSSVYLTANNWLKRRQNESKQSTQKGGSKPSTGEALSNF